MATITEQLAALRLERDELHSQREKAEKAAGKATETAVNLAGARHRSASRATQEEVDAAERSSVAARAEERKLAAALADCDKEIIEVETKVEAERLEACRLELARAAKARAKFSGALDKAMGEVDRAVEGRDAENSTVATNRAELLSAASAQVDAIEQDYLTATGRAQAAYQEAYNKAGLATGKEINKFTDFSGQVTSASTIIEVNPETQLEEQSQARRALEAALADAEKRRTEAYDALGLGVTVDDEDALLAAIEAHATTLIRLLPQSVRNDLAHVAEFWPAGPSQSSGSRRIYASHEVGPAMERWQRA